MTNKLRLAIGTLLSAAALFFSACSAYAQTAVYNTSPPVLVNRQQSALQADVSGNLKVTVGGDANGVPVQPALSANFWAFAGATGGIVNTTTAVTIKAAAGAGVRNYLCTLNVGHDALGAATELAVRDGASGTVIYRMKLQTAAQEGASEVTFLPCLKGTANTLMEVVTLTATVTGGTYVNASGYPGL